MKRSPLMTIPLALGALLLAGALGSCGRSAGASDSGRKPSPDTLKMLLSMKTAQGFSDRAVSDEALKTILDAGANAPSAMNQQPWYFTAVLNRDVQNRIREASRAMVRKMRPAEGPQGGEPGDSGEPPAPPLGAGAKKSPPGLFAGKPGGLPGAGTGGRDPLFGAPVVIVISGKNDWRWSSFDTALATANMGLAAQALGLGSRIVAGPVEAISGPALPEFRTLLALPEDMEPVAILLVGYPAGGNDAVSKASTRKEGAFNILK